MKQPTLLNRRVMLVEDDYFIAEAMLELFIACGASVLGPVGRVSEALALLEATIHMDGAVLDVNLHGTTVFAVADSLRDRGIPFVFATGYERSGVIPQRFSDILVFEKPIEPAMVIEALCK